MNEPHITLMSLIEDFAVTEGFQYVKSQESFRRSTAYGFDEFLWIFEPVGSNPHDFVGEVGLGIREDKIDFLVQDIWPTYPPEARKRNPVLFRALGNYFPFDKKRDAAIKIRSKNFHVDCEEAIRKAKEMLLRDGFDWFKKYSDVNNLSKTLNANIPERMQSDPVLHSVINNSISIPTYGIAASCLAEPHNTSQFMNEYLEYIWQWGGAEWAAKERETGELKKMFDKILVRAKELELDFDK